MENGNQKAGTGDEITIKWPMKYSVFEFWILNFEVLV